MGRTLSRRRDQRLPRTVAAAVVDAVAAAVVDDAVAAAAVDDAVAAAAVDDAVAAAAVAAAVRDGCPECARHPRPLR